MFFHAYDSYMVYVYSPAASLSHPLFSLSLSLSLYLTLSE